MRLIDADTCLNRAWQNFYKQEDEHAKNIDGYDITCDQFYEQSGFECCQQTIVNAPTVEAILKTDYEARLKDDMAAILTELKNELIDISWNIDMYDNDLDFECCYLSDIDKVIRQKIDKLKGERNDN